jgi:putative Ca2+/H+ antiporter (TMEM165/GDT1 family)
MLILFGLLAALKGPDYGPGTLMHMGPGFMPTALGVILILLGLAIAVDEQILPDHPQWFAWGCILASPLMFIIFGTYFGMFPGTFMCIFVAALGDKTQTYKSAVALALIVGVAGTALFSYLLQVPMPILTWPGGSL